MKKTLLIYAVVATLLLIAMGNDHARLLNEKRRLDQNISTLTSDIALYRTRHGESAAEVQSLRLRQSELESLNAELSAEIKALGIRLRRINSAAEAATQTEIDFSATLPDSILFRPVADTLHLPLFADDWSTLHATLAGNRLEGRFTSVDTLHQIVYRVPHRFLFFNYGTKELRQIITSSNPHTRLVYSSHITIERHRK